jgi:hypothetical protein
MPASRYHKDVFFNYPLDPEYRPLREAIVFTIHDCGLAARSALEVTDTSQVRIDKVTAIIASCKFGLHDISRTELDVETGLPRFNMPFELGLFLGAKRFGTGRQRVKNCLVLDIDRYRYQRFISDIAGQDILAHAGKPAQAIRVVRNWLSDARPVVKIPGGSTIADRYVVFLNDLPAMCARVHLLVDELTFNDYVIQVEEWLKTNPWTPS